MYGIIPGCKQQIKSPNLIKEELVYTKLLNVKLKEAINKSKYVVAPQITMQ